MSLGRSQNTSQACRGKKGSERGFTHLVWQKNVVGVNSWQRGIARRQQVLKQVAIILRLCKPQVHGKGAVGAPSQTAHCDGCFLVVLHPTRHMVVGPALSLACIAPLSVLHRSFLQVLRPSAMQNSPTRHHPSGVTSSEFQQIQGQQQCHASFNMRELQRTGLALRMRRSLPDGRTLDVATLGMAGQTTTRSAAHRALYDGSKERVRNPGACSAVIEEVILGQRPGSNCVVCQREKV